MANKEYEAMIQSTEKMTDVIAANDPLSIGTALLTAGLLPHNVHSELSTNSIATERARKIVAALTLKVNAQSSDFQKMVAVFKSKGLNNLVDSLQKNLETLNGGATRLNEETQPKKDSTPTLRELKLLQIGNESVKIVEQTCVEWKAIGELLDFDNLGDKVTIIDKEHDTLEEKLGEVFKLWMKEQSRRYRPPTWRTLIKLLRDSGHGALAHKLDTLLT